MCCELALWELFDFLALKGLHRVAQGKRSATLGRIGTRIICNTLKGLHKKNIYDEITARLNSKGLAMKPLQGKNRFLLTSQPQGAPRRA